MPNYNKSFNFRNGVQVDEDDLIVRSSLVGIGTTIPTSELDVRGDTKVSGVVTTSELYVTGISTFGDVHIGTGVTVYSSLGIISATKFQGDGSLLRNLPTSQWVDINESGIGVTSIYAIGNVGIGTTDPTGTTLQIGGDAQLGQPGVGIGSDGNIHASGVITATTYYGTGTNLTALNASNITTGTLKESFLPENLDVTGVITAISANITNLNTLGVSTFAKESSFAKQVSINSDLKVTGVSTFSGVVNIDSDLNTNTINITDTIAHTGDLNTKIRFPTADTITAETAGSERLRITSAGKVGINSTSPTYALEVDGGTQNTVIVARSSDAKAAISFLDNTSGGYGRATIGGEGDEVYITSGAGVERLRIQADGNINVRESINVVGITTLKGKVGLDTTGALKLPRGTTSERPSDASTNTPYIRWNSTNSALEVYTGNNWAEIITDYFPNGSTTFN